MLSTKKTTRYFSLKRRSDALKCYTLQIKHKRRFSTLPNNWLLIHLLNMIKIESTF